MLVEALVAELAVKAFFCKRPARQAHALQRVSHRRQFVARERARGSRQVSRPRLRRNASTGNARATAGMMHPVRALRPVAAPPARTTANPRRRDGVPTG